MTATNEQNPVKEREFVSTRTVNAPAAVVYQAWTEREHVDKWWGPYGFATTTSEMNVQPGGIWRYVMHGPDGTDYLNKITYREVEPNGRLVYHHEGEGALAHIHFDVTVTFEAEGNRTKLTMRMTCDTVADFKLIMNDFAKAGNKQHLDNLEAHLAAMSGNKQDFTITRTFNAPRQLVYDVFTRPEHMAKWWGPKGFTMLVNNMDLRPGGSYHYCMASPEGYRMWGKFVYVNIDAPRSIVFINSFSDEEGNLTRHPMAPTWPLEVYNILTLTEADGKTTLTLSGHPINATQEEIAIFNAMHESMQQGFKGTFDQLEEYLTTI